MDQESSQDSVVVKFLKALGPAVIVASVVLGPGSILSNTKVGAAYGFSMVWVVLLAGGLMMGMVALGARLGVVLKGTMCDELAARIGRPFAALVGLTIFLVCAGFQFGNNLGVLAALDPWLGESQDAEGIGRLLTKSNLVLLLLNGSIIAFLFALPKLYRPVERLMMVLVGLMILAFFGNFFFLLMAGSGQAPAEAVGEPKAADVLAVLALIGTTFSVAGAFYQAYLVREKGWGMGDLRRGMIDSVAGIGMLGAISLVIMCTAAISFYGRNVNLASVADVAVQLKPLFGPAALILFSLGLFAGAFSSFMVNAMIGGAMLSDGLGLGGKMDSTTTKVFTTIALLVGMFVAILAPTNEDRVGLLVFAQAMVLIGFPLLAFSMLYLATRRDLKGARATPLWLTLVAAIGSLFVLAGACVTGWKLIAPYVKPYLESLQAVS